MEVGRNMSAMFGNHVHKATELCLALPGETKVTGKRALSETVDLISKLRSEDSDLKSPALEKNILPPNDPPAAKALVVGWPPVRSFRKIALANLRTGNGGEPEETTFVKVSIDGAPFLRKVDLKSYRSYQELWDALAKIFTSFNMGYNLVGKDANQKEGLIDFMNEDNTTESAAIYQDRDGDWMLVGDVPWEMFVGSCKRLRIVKGSEATGLGTQKQPVMGKEGICTRRSV